MYTITVATSIAPKNIEKQIIAVDSWLILGLKVISVNCPAEIIQLSPQFPNVLFIPAERLATKLTGKPLVFLDDLLAALQVSGSGICGIVNSDIVLQNLQDFPAFLQKHCFGSFVYGPRLDVDNLGSSEGSLYQCGRDYFFFECSFINLVPASDFSIGSPWWDLWLPLVAENVGKRLIQPLDWIALHVRHPAAWNHEVFWAMSTIFLNLISNYNLNVKKHPHYHSSSDLMEHHRHQNAMITLVYNFLTEKTLILPVSPTDNRQLTADITLNPSAEYSLIFHYVNGRDVQFLIDCVEELERLAFSDKIEIIIIVEYWHENHAVHDFVKNLSDRYGNITAIRMMTHADKQSVLDAASRFVHGTAIISMDNVIPYYTVDPEEMVALRNYYKKRFYKHLDVLARHLVPKASTAAERFIAISTEKAENMFKAGYPGQAIELYREILSAFPDNHKVLFIMAKMYRNAGRIDEALPLLYNIPHTSSYYADSLFTLGMILVNKRDFTRGADCFRSVLKLDDRHVEAHNNLALCLVELARPEEAQEHFTTAIKLAPDRAEAYNNLGNLLVNYWKLAEAAEFYRRAIEIKHDYAGAYSNLGRIANYEGRIDEAIALFLKALEIQPEFRTAADNLLFILNNSDTYTPEQVSKEHFRLSHIYPVYTETILERKSSRSDKIRVGYVSPDFKSHSVGFFIEPVLSRHSKDDFEIFCYDQVTVPDETTERIKNLGWTWRPVFGRSDHEVADLVRTDAIDILVDLSGHSDGNRLGVFALRPAPIQVTWLGYPNTTGLKQIDYRLTDALADPFGMTDHLYYECLVRLPRSFLCYAPPASAPEIAPLSGEPFTFCCFNNYPKISDTVLRLWARILHAVPDSKLLIKCGPLGDSDVRARLTKRFTALDIDPSRLILAGFEVSREEHLQRYGTCHVALDTYPYNGTTTTCEALWMGVPVVTLAGTIHASRVGVSILENSGLSELIALNTDQYVDIAVALAKNPARLQEYRYSLRTRLRSSQLLDAVSFTADLERVYRRMLDQPHD